LSVTFGGPEGRSDAVKEAADIVWGQGKHTPIERLRIRDSETPRTYPPKLRPKAPGSLLRIPLSSRRQAICSLDLDDGIWHAFFPRGRDLRPEVASLRLSGTPIMAQWATGVHVTRWTDEAGSLLKAGSPKPSWIEQ
jgi:hypothetical protein